MRFGLAIPTCREGLAYDQGFASPSVVCDIGYRAEQLGYDAVWGNQHFVTPPAVRSSGADRPGFHDPLVIFSYLAARTERIRLVLATVVMPAWPPLLLAKQIVTLDHLSAGRAVLGLGGGAYPEEMRPVVGAVAGGRERTRRTEEALRAFRSLFEQDPSDHDGAYYAFEDVGFHPKPLQRRLPVYLAASTPPGIARAGRLADGWIAASRSPQDIADGARELRAAADGAGRDPSDVAVCCQLWVATAPTHEAARRRCEESQHVRRLRRTTGASSAELVERLERTDLVGTPGEIAERLGSYAEAGVDHVGLVVLARDVPELLDSAAGIAEEVIACMR